MEKVDFLSLALSAAKIADDKKASDIVILDVKDLTSICNYLVIITAHSTPQINAISHEMEKSFKDMELYVLRKDGSRSNSWKVLDYGGLIVHIMSQEIRAVYDLDDFWKSAKDISPRPPKPKAAPIDVVDLDAFIEKSKK
jgi:ribosome-associated protein